MTQKSITLNARHGGKSEALRQMKSDFVARELELTGFAPLVKTLRPGADVIEIEAITETTTDKKG